MAPKSSLTPQQARDLLGEVLDSVRGALADRGIEVAGEVRACHPRDVDLAVFLRVSPSSPDARQEFQQHAPSFGLYSHHFGAEFPWDGSSWRLVGLNPRAPKNPIEAEHIPSGVSRRLPKEALWFIQQAVR